MKTGRFGLGMCMVAMLAGAANTAMAANTPGSATFSVGTTAYTATYNPNHVAVVWVVDSSNKFVKTLCRHAGSRINYLSRWSASRGTYTNVDGTTSATLTRQPTNHVVTWNCRGTNNAVVPDGMYYFKVEYTSANGAGPYLTNGAGFMKGTAAVTTNFSNYSSGGGQFTGMAITYAPILPDIAVRAVSPATGYVNSNVAVVVGISNQTASATTPFTVALSNVTAAATLVATQQVASLAASANTNVTFIWSTAGLTAGTYRLKAQAFNLASETNLANNVLTNAIVLAAAVHDLAVKGISAGAVIPPRVVTNVVVAVSNAGVFAETFAMSMTDLSDGLAVGTRTVTNLAARATTNVVFAWNTTNSAIGYHLLQAVAGPVAGETLTADNTRTLTTIVANGLETNVLVARGSAWKYLDSGLDISGAPWTQPAANYYDGFWASGPAPLGYGAAGIATTTGYGTATNKHLTTYFRKEFTVDSIPIAVTGLVRREDGVVLYLNGRQIDQQNLPAGAAIDASTPASSDLSGPAATNYTAFSVSPSHFVAGRNWLAAEVHLFSGTSASLAFDLEIQAIGSAMVKTGAVAPVSILPDGDVQSGDPLGATVTLSNTGNVAAACTLLIRDASTGTILASQSVPVLAAGETTDVHLSWTTLGLATGQQILQAVTVVNGVTNLAGAISNTVAVSAPDFAPRRVGADGSLGGWCGAVAVSGTTVFLGCGATLEIWNAQNPASPVRIGAIRLPGLIEGLVAGGTAVHAAAGASGVHVVDVSDPAAPVHVATFDTSGNAHRLALSGSTLFIADGLGGVRSLQVATPAAPVLAGAYSTAGAARSLVHAPPHLYVLDSDEGLQIITTNAVPARLGQEGRVTAGLGLAGVAGAAIVTDANGGLYRIATTNPAAPTIATNIHLAAAGRSIASSASALYVAAGPEGILTIHPSTLAVVATNAVNGEASDIALSGATLYVAAGFGGAQAWSVANPLAPVLLGTFGTAIRAVDAEMSGDLLYVAGDEAGFQIHSLTNLSVPERMAAVAATNHVRYVAVSGSRAYVAEFLGGLKIYSIANPAAPSLVGTVPADGLATIRRLVASGSRVALTDGYQIRLLDLTDPAAPVPLASHVPPGYVFDLAASTSHIFAACGGGGLRILDPSTLGLVGSYSAAPAPILTVGLVGSYAYAGDGQTMLHALDISNPAAPVLAQSLSGAGFGLASARTWIYGVDGKRAGTSQDVSAPLTPVSGLSLSNLTAGLRIRAQGAVVLVAEDEAGLSIFNANPGDINLNGIDDEVDRQIAEASGSDALTTLWDIQAGDDFDGDGLTNLAEALAGTSPTNAASFFAISAANAASAGATKRFVVRWYSENGRTYTVHKTTNLVSGFTAVQAGIAGDYPVSSYTDTVSAAATYYMISVP